jgi:hypothetical protein
MRTVILHSGSRDFRRLKATEARNRNKPKEGLINSQFRSIDVKNTGNLIDRRLKFWAQCGFVWVNAAHFRGKKAVSILSRMDSSSR